MSSPRNVDSKKVGHVLQSPEEVLSTLSQDGKRRWLYPTLSHGQFLNARRIVGWILILLFTALPLIRIQGKPAVFLDVVHREFTFFGLTLYSTDTGLVMAFLIGTLVAVFFVTALLGRVWCGWACPQTVYLEFVYRPIERLLEGSESIRKRRDEGPMNWDKLWRKVVKYAIYAAISLALAHTFVAYFVSWERLIEWMLRPPMENWSFFVMMALTTGLVLFDFAIFREQMCTITCPYARIQSVLLDPDSMIVSYDPGRGEPRGRRTRKDREDEKVGLNIGKGDCIDCYACVRTCPTGIDIRNGLQMECIGCTQCIDACDHVMISIGKPVGLIRYTSERALEGIKTRILRPRVLFYGALLTLLTAVMIALVAARPNLDVNIGRGAGTGGTFLAIDDAHVANRLRFRIQNRSEDAIAEIVAVEPAGAEVRVVGTPTIEAPSGATIRVETVVVVPVNAFVDGSVTGVFDVRLSNGLTTRETYQLLGPSKP